MTGHLSNGEKSKIMQIIGLDDKRGGMIVFANTLAANGVIARAAQPTRLLLIAGHPLKEPIAQTAGS